MQREELLKGLTDEQIARVKACKNQEELLKLAQKEDIELSDEQLAAVSGGSLMCATSTSLPKCPHCNSTNTAFRNLGPITGDGNPYIYQCNDCLKVF